MGIGTELVREGLISFSLVLGMYGTVRYCWYGLVRGIPERVKNAGM